MPAPIVYEGVGGGGVLFQDLKFWVAIRVPLRTEWVNKIRVSTIFEIRNEDADFLRLTEVKSFLWK